MWRIQFPSLKYGLCLLLFVFSCKNSKDLPNDYLITPREFHKVTLNDGFWSPRMKVQAEKLIPFAFEKTKPAVDNLAKTAHFLKGIEDALPFPHRYISSDLYKVMEGAAYLLMNNKEPAIEAKMDSIIELIGDAQQADGYLYVAHTTGVAKNHDAWGGGGMGDRPYSHLVHSHELYNMGHMYEAAIAYYLATGKKRWLNIAEKNAEHLFKVFFEGDPNYNDGIPVMQAPGHQEIELALVKLYRVTGKKKYLKMATKFLAIRGVTYRPEGEQYMSPTYAQQHKPVKEQTQAVGHAVRAMYMYAAMADVDALSGTREYEIALHEIWRNLVDKKMHITGGLGASKGIEGFGENYILPNKDAYNETCAAVGNVLFNYRMYLKTGDAKYIDVAEIALYNNVLAGVSLSGDRFFYVNPLEADGENQFNHGTAGRSPWFNTACCPTNLARLLPQVSGMLYAHRRNEIYFNLFAGSDTRIPLEGQSIDIQQRTDYPYDGGVSIKLDFRDRMKFKVYLRIPHWARSQFVPGDLYDYLSATTDKWSVTINEEPFTSNLKDGYFVIEREWDPGDIIKLELPMPVRFNRSVNQVVENRKKLALTRGPLLYCAEEIDNEKGFGHWLLPKEVDPMHPQFNRLEIDSQWNTVQIKINAHPNHSIDLPSHQLNLVPYYLWNNRGNGAMKVWLDHK